MRSITSSSGRGPAADVILGAMTSVVNVKAGYGWVEV